MAFTPTRSGNGEINTPGLETSDVTRLKQLEAESARKDRVITRLTMEVDAVRELIGKYNEIRPHSALGYLRPRELAEQVQTNQPSQLSAA
jgi:transposase InsO family protein